MAKQTAVKATVDTSGFRDFAARLKQVRPEWAKELRVRIREAANDVAAQGRSNASWSNTIPGTIRVTGVTANSASVSAGNAKVPIAKWYEQGRTDNGVWRHPLWGNKKHWYDQTRPLRPYLVPALQDQQGNVTAKVAQAMSDALADAGVEG